MQKNNQLFKWVQMGIYAALIALAIQFIRIPLPSALSNSFVHPGNALIVLSGLLMGPKRGIIASSAGTAIFDLLNGYAAEIPGIIIENAIIILLVELFYRTIFKRQDTKPALISTGIFAGLCKLAIVFIKFFIGQIILGSQVQVAFYAALSGLPASFFSAIFTAVLTPILYYPMKQIFQRYHPIGE
ncbi:ECF transporter S component [Hutsoniella sourekii]